MSKVDGEVDRYGHWVSGLGSDATCMKARCVQLELKKVPLGPNGKRAAVEVFRTVAAISTLGISTWFNGGIKDYSHEVRY
jgi:hypothetical protein